jgi:hypothetical protein
LNTSTHNSQSEPFPKPRPAHFNEEICQIAVWKEWKNIRRYLDINTPLPPAFTVLAPDERDAFDQVVDALRYHHDGYARAKYLDDHHMWDGNSELVELMDSVSTFQAVQDAEAQWVLATQPTCPYVVGETVEYSWLGDNPRTGVIAAIDTKRAYVEISFDPKSTSRTLIPWECKTLQKKPQTPPDETIHAQPS